MGFYHPSTLVKDAQRRGVRFHPIDVQISDWNCTVEDDGAVRLGLRYVAGLREETGKIIAATSHGPRATSHEPRATSHGPRATSHEPRFGSLDNLVNRTGLR